MPSSGVQTCALDRKSTRLNSSHGSISYAVFCLQKNLKQLALITSKSENAHWTDIIPDSTNHHNTVEKLYMHSEKYRPLSFITFFINLQEPAIDNIFVPLLNAFEF